MQVEFVGYAADCVIAGEVALASDRLTDLLTGTDEYDVVNVTLEVLDDTRILSLETVKILREDLCLVAATGPRGNAGRRVRTRPHPMLARVGPYEVFGFIHALPTADPVTAALRRSIIPMTSGWIRYRRGAELVERRHDGMLVNRAQIVWLEQATNEDALLPKALELPIAINSGAKDLTGEIYV